jgi:hypothetical protein
MNIGSRDVTNIGDDGCGTLGYVAKMMLDALQAQKHWPRMLLGDGLYQLPCYGRIPSRPAGSTVHELNNPSPA